MCDAKGWTSVLANNALANPLRVQTCWCFAQSNLVQEGVRYRCGRCRSKKGAGWALQGMTSSACTTRNLGGLCSSSSLAAQIIQLSDMTLSTCTCCHSALSSAVAAAGVALGEQQHCCRLPCTSPRLAPCVGR
jgi:hypothetical protein